MKNTKEVYDRLLDCFFYHMLGEKLPTKEHFLNLQKAKSWGLKISDTTKVVQDIEGVIEFVKDKLNSNTDFLFGIYFDTRHIGNIKLGPIDFNHKVSDISFFIGDKEMWGKGLMTQVIDFVVGFAFNDVGLAKVTAGAYANNIGTIKTLENNGFIVEGRRINQTLFEGERIDAVIFGKVRKCSAYSEEGKGKR